MDFPLLLPIKLLPHPPHHTHENFEPLISYQTFIGTKKLSLKVLKISRMLKLI